MVLSLRNLLFTAAATLLSAPATFQALAASDIPADTPISSLLKSANSHLAKGEIQDALTFYDLAIHRDPSNYLSHFRRGAAYLSLGRGLQAASDFDTVLSLRPDHEQARLQRAKIRGKHGDWEGASDDYVAHGNAASELEVLSEAQGAAALALDAEKSGKWDECITQSGMAILVATRLLPLRKTRARCRFERGEVEEGLVDLRHMLSIQPGLTEPHLQMSAISFYSLDDVEKGLDQMRKCLHSDPDSKSCKKLYRRQKTLEKQLSQVSKHISKKNFASALKILNPSKEDVGLLQEVKDDSKEYRDQGLIPTQAPRKMEIRLVEMVCEAYFDSRNHKKAGAACTEALEVNEHSLYGLLHKAQLHSEAEAYEAAITTLKQAREHHPDTQIINQQLQNAELQLKRSKTKDYYKVLGLQRDADEVQIKAAYRRMVKVNHPDKAHKLGIGKEEAEKKMAAINEAYEVLSDPELKARFDRGDDPNDHAQQQQHPFQQGGGGFQFQGNNPFGSGGPFGGHQQFQFKFH